VPSDETSKALGHGLHSFTGKQHHACLYLVSVHQMELPQISICSLLLIYWPREDERLSWPGCLTYSGWFTHISGHPLAVRQAQDRESLLVKNQLSTAVLPTCVCDFDAFN